MARQPHIRDHWRIAASIGLAIAMLAASGCYRRVISAKGFGASETEVSEPYQQNTVIDDWIYGKQDDKNRRR